MFGYYIFKKKYKLKKTKIPTNINCISVLFNLLYNYIKFKMLPSSLQTKNRLYVERDSKFRRIVLSFGTTFRNSKWSDYSIKNINNQPVNWISSFFKYLIIIFFILSTDFLFFNNIIFTTIIPYFNFFNDHSDIRNTLKVLLTEALPAAINEGLKILIITFFNNGPIFFNFVNEKLNQNQKYKYEDNTMVTRFNNWTPNYFLINSFTSFNPIFFKNFYNNYKFELSDTKPNPLNSVTPKLLPTIPSFWNSTTTNNLNNTGNFLSIQNWTLINVVNEDNYNKLNGTFYISNFNYNKLNLLNLNNEFNFISNSIENQVDTIKIVRWLYRYNVLHRKTLKQSHNLTLSKKLISSGFFDSKIMTNNLWFSDTYSRLNDSKQLTNILKNQWNTMYSNSLNQIFINNKNKNNFNIYKNNFNYLNFYESSFFFFNKRAYQFLGLNNNLFNTTLKLSNKSVTKLNNYTLLNNQFLLSNMLDMFAPKNDLLNPYNYLFNEVQIKDNNITTNYSKDILPVYIENDIFTNDLLYITFNSTKSFNNSLQVFDFYNPQFILKFKDSDFDYDFDLITDFDNNK